jgi:hypothetical protein
MRPLIPVATIDLSGDCASWARRYEGRRRAFEQPGISQHSGEVDILRGQVGAPVECTVIPEDLRALRLHQNGDRIARVKIGKHVLVSMRCKAKPHTAAHGQRFAR